MADTWDGATSNVGVLTAVFNTDHTAIRFSRSDLVKFEDDVPMIICQTMEAAFKRAIEEIEQLANDVEKIDQRFANLCRAQAQKYRDAIAPVPPPPLTALAKAKPSSKRK